MKSDILPAKVVGDDVNDVGFGIGGAGDGHTGRDSGHQSEGGYYLHDLKVAAGEVSHQPS